MAKAPTTTKAPETRSTDTDEPVTKLAQVADPAKITKADVDEIAGKDRDPTKSDESANADVAATLEQAKKDAKSKNEPEQGYFAGQGGAAGV